MSRSLSYDINVSVARWLDLLRALASCFVPASAAPSAEEALISLVDRLRSSPGASECITLAFPPDPPLLAFQAEHGDIAVCTPGTVAVGCFWARVRQQDDNICLSLDSATAAIATLMRESLSVRSRFLQIADAASATILVTDEWHASERLSLDSV